MELVLITLWHVILLYAPAYVANMAPPIAASLKLPGGGSVYVPWFGTQKTWRGIVSGIVSGTCTALLLWYLGWSWFGGVPLFRAGWGGVFLGLGAMLGDLVKSGLKRSFQIAPGKPWVPWDQIDFVLGATFVASILIPFSYRDVLLALLITPPLHLLVNVISYCCGIKKVWW
jgi:CDP-2,3-bis-(O-geranylgeranyl)-sn-glycerol synthase